VVEEIAHSYSKEDIGAGKKPVTREPGRGNTRTNASNPSQVETLEEAKHKGKGKATAQQESGLR
jgi:hypothetical protein